MAVRIARQTLIAIDQEIQKDQGSRFRQILGTVLPHIGDAYRVDDDPFRSHMGGSIIGGECARAIWYSWRWVTRPKFDGRIIRLFNRGHLEEGRFISLLLLIGVQVYQQDSEGKQFRISHANGHFGGSGDGVGVGIPDIPQETAALLEFKTHGEKSFVELAGKNWRKHLEDPIRNPFDGKGVRDAKFEHYVQMNVYMRKMGLPIALYAAVNKNTDDLYLEIVVLDIKVADDFLARGEKLIESVEPPTKLNQSPGFWKCRFCDHRPVCHLNSSPERNCRTCVYSKPADDGKWVCLRWDNYIDKEVQITGCDSYEQHPNI